MVLKPNLSCNADHRNRERPFMMPPRVAANVRVWSPRNSSAAILYTFAIYKAWKDPMVDMRDKCQNLLVLIASLHVT